MKTIKAGASVAGLRTEILIAWYIANEVYEKYRNPRCVLTSGTDGKHKEGSLHYVGLAIDLRTNNFPDGGCDSFLVDAVVEVLAERLGEEYDVVRESNHIHIEFNP